MKRGIRNGLRLSEELEGPLLSESKDEEEGESDKMDDGEEEEEEEEEEDGSSESDDAISKESTSFASFCCRCFFKSGACSSVSGDVGGLTVLLFFFDGIDPGLIVFAPALTPYGGSQTMASNIAPACHAVCALS